MAQCASKNVPVKGLNDITLIILVVTLAGSFSNWEN